jgi:hypothetical protein
MTFVIVWRNQPEARNEIQERFLKTGGPPPEGVKMIGRWSRIGGGEGVCIGETDDPVALGKWAQDWNDLMQFEIYPATDDQTTVKVIS